MNRILFSTFLLFSCSLLQAQFYNGSQLEFGKNRVQHKSPIWSFYRYQRYDVFFFAGGKELSEDVAEQASVILPEFEQWFNYSMENRMEFLIFDRLSNLCQTNVGLGSKGVDLGGTTQLVDSKILLYHTGSTIEFNQQIKAGIAEAFVNEFLYGSDFRSRIRSSTLMNIPDWYRKGLVRYMSRPWSTESNSRLREGIIEGRYFKFNRLQGEDAILAGESIWHYVAQTYGQNVIADIVEMTRITRNVDNGFQYVLGLDIKGITQEWINYYDKKFYPSKDLFSDYSGEALSGKNRRRKIYLQPSYSDNGEFYSYVANEAGKAIIHIYDTKTDKRLAKIKMGRRLPSITDYSFPVTCWHPNNELLVYTDEFKGRLRLNFYSIKDKEIQRKFIDDVQKIIAFDIAPNGKDFAITALKDGKVDLLLFNNISNTFDAITEDLWDEGSPSWTPDGESILISSNRPKDSLEIKDAASPLSRLNHDLFQIYPFDRTVKQLTKTPTVHESFALSTGARSLAFLSNANGMNNLYLAEFDSAIVSVDTVIHYNYFIKSQPASNVDKSLQDFAISNTDVLTVSTDETRSRISKASLKEFRAGFKNELPHAAWSPERSSLPASTPQPEKKNKAEKSKTRIKRIVVFGQEEEQVQQAETPTYDTKSDSTFQLSRQRIYETAYYPEYLVTRIDRSFLNQTYQPYSSGGFSNPSANGLFKFAIADLFEDYRLTGGVRLSLNLTGNEYLLSFESVRKKIDHSFFFHRQGVQSAILEGKRVMLHTLGAKLSKPFNQVARLEGSIAYRNDRTVYLSTDLANLNRQNEMRHWAQAKLEFVWDNSFPVGLNMFTGMRAKATLEHFHRLDSTGSHVTIAGFDVRNYGRIMREMIWATRVAGASSFGPNKLLFYLGGVDNWFIPRFDNSVSVDESQNYIFQTLGTNVRGFFQNIRNGSSFAVVNAEVRWNALKFFSKYPLRSDFFNSMQVVGFADVGTAFTGSSPYSEENTFNQQTITSGPITVVLKNQREPLVAGLGLGLRTRVLGYFVRVDYARGIEDASFLSPIIYLSLATDF